MWCGDVCSVACCCVFVGVYGFFSVRVCWCCVVVVVVPLPQSRSRLAAMLSQLRALQHAGLEGTDTVLAPLLPQWAKKPKLATTATELQLMSAVCHLWGLCCPPNCREQKTNIKYNESLAISSQVTSYLLHLIFPMCFHHGDPLEALKSAGPAAWKVLEAMSRSSINHACCTPWKVNIAPENIPSQKETCIPTIIFQGVCYTSGV